MTPRLFLFIFLLLAYGSLPFNAHASATDQQFEATTKYFIEKFLRINPEQATALGDHRFDMRSRDPSRKGIARELALYRTTLDALKRIQPSQLSLADGIDYRILQNELEGRIFAIEVLKEYQWDTLSFNPAQGIYVLLARNFAPLPQRLAAVKARLQAIPRQLAAAKNNLHNPPRVHTETAIDQNKGAVALVRDELEIYLKDAPAMRQTLAAPRATAIAALEAYGTWLQNDLLPRSNGDFRLGAENYRRKLRYALESDIAPEEVLRRAQAELVKTQQTLFETAQPLYRQYFPDRGDMLADPKALVRAVLSRLGDDQPNRENVVELAELDLAEAAAFVREKNLLTLPDDPVKVIVMPEFQRGVAMAYCEVAGALEKHGESFYAISPAPAHWTQQKVESYYREDNRSMLKDLTVHEAMPGHYVQGVVANKAHTPTLVRRIVYSGTFAEGWATYAEQMMVEAGFGGAPVKMQQLKMRLRLIINAIIDQKIHAGSMTEKEAMDLMMNEGFQEEREATGKWRRALLTSTQLSTYFVGNTEVNDLRRDFESKHGKDNLKRMHDTMLSFGTISTKYIREMMDL